MRAGSLPVAVLLALAIPASARCQSVRVQIIDVGQADAILVRTPGGQFALIDAGQGTLVADSLPTHFRVSRLALAIGSHRHKDHIGGMDNVLARIPVALYVGDTAEYASGDDDDRLRAMLRQRSIPVHPATPDTITVDNVHFILLPRDPDTDANENDNSLLVRLEYGAFSMLLSGDAEVSERNWLVANHPGLLRTRVLKASHHGSRNGTSTDWLSTVSPDVVVISVGSHAGFRLPNADAVDGYIAIVGSERLSCTNRHGTIRIFGYLDGHSRVYRQKTSSRGCAFDGT